MTSVDDNSFLEPRGTERNGQPTRKCNLLWSRAPVIDHQQRQLYVDTTGTATYCSVVIRKASPVDIMKRNGTKRKEERKGTKGDVRTFSTRNASVTPPHVREAYHRTSPIETHESGTRYHSPKRGSAIVVPRMLKLRTNAPQIGRAYV